GDSRPEGIRRVLRPVFPGAVMDENPGRARTRGVNDHAERLDVEGPRLQVDAVRAERQVGATRGRGGGNDESRVDLCAKPLWQDARQLAAGDDTPTGSVHRSEEHTSELQSLTNLVC